MNTKDENNNNTKRVIIKVGDSTDDNESSMTDDANEFEYSMKRATNKQNYLNVDSARCGKKANTNLKQVRRPSIFDFVNDDSIGSETEESSDLLKFISRDNSSSQVPLLQISMASDEPDNGIIIRF